jgi:hypothetical protein
MQNFADQIDRIRRANPNLTHEQVGIVLTAEFLYRVLPQGLSLFRSMYPHFDPRVIQSNPSGITLLRIANDRKPSVITRRKLNSYLNIKFSVVAQGRTYEENRKIFKWYSGYSSAVIDDLLNIAGYPESITARLRELPDVRDCSDIFELVQMYGAARIVRTKFEILRKVGLIVLLARINQGVGVLELDHRMEDIWDGIRQGLGYRSGKKKAFNYILENGSIRIMREDAPSSSVFECRPFRSKKGNVVLHLAMRNKFKDGDRLTYTSFVEKMIRKNLEYPSQIHDMLGAKIIVSSEEEIADLIHELESFLGGSSTRKQEKDTYHRFGRKLLDKHSSPDYFVWKAIYDITLPHPGIRAIEKACQCSRDKATQDELQRLQQLYSSDPRDYLIEVQLQDLKSHILSIAPGSKTEHARLKKNQVRSNSFYKMFPKEIYEQEVLRTATELLKP